MIKMKILIFSCVISIVIGVHSAKERVDPLVLTDQGYIRGLKGKDGYYSYFLGVPYAEVDLDNPFGSTNSPPDFGSKVFNADDGSIICPQLDMENTGRKKPRFKESLDCLKLNIYVPYEASTEDPASVLVWIHGGAFSTGHGTEYHPKNLIKQGIIVVTINYRLGPYGFMCLDSPFVSGNQGLKDQYEALRWVRNNIAAFGGNASDVTIAGHGAGSSAVLLHLYSPKKKLFDKVIAQSGTPQSEGMFVESDMEAAVKLANYLGFNTSDTEEALKFLTEESHESVTKAALKLKLTLRPCKEKSYSGLENFFNKYPFSLSNVDKVKDTPILIGHTSQEEGDLRLYDSEYFKTDPFINRLKNNFNFNDEVLKKNAKNVRQFYIGEKAMSTDLTHELSDFESDFLINHPTQRIIDTLLNENASPVYQYVFSYVVDSAKVAGRSAELPYLFETEVKIGDNEESRLLSERVVTLWANFVKYGNVDGTIRLLNEHVLKQDADILYHLGFDTLNYDLPALFGDVKFICMGGTKHRMRDFAVYIGGVLNIPVADKPINLSKHSHRYAMYKVGPVLSVSHGIGIPSMTILLQEVIKLLFYAKAKDPIIFRIGTSGGLSIPPGSVVVSAWGMNGTLGKSYDIPVLGKLRQIPAYFDERLAKEVSSLGSEDDHFKTYIGGTMAADDFYRGQARLDGPVCDYTEEDKLSFLNQLSQLGVKNIEMEATAFAAYTREVRVRASDVCVTLLNRLEGDQVTPSKKTLLEWQTRPMVVVGRYIQKYLQNK